MDAEEKYHLAFATANNKGAVLASDIVYGIEEEYQLELQRHQQPGQHNMFDESDALKDAISNSIVKALAQDIWERYKGRAVSRLDLHGALLDKWFGLMKGRHLTSALRQLEASPKRIIGRSGILSADDTIFTFATS